MVARLTPVPAHHRSSTVILTLGNSRIRIEEDLMVAVKVCLWLCASLYSGQRVVIVMSTCAYVMMCVWVVSLYSLYRC